MFKRMVPIFVAALLAVVFGVAAHAGDKKEVKTVTRDQVPMSVIAAFEKAYPNVTVKVYEQKTRGEKVWYSIVFVDGAATKEVRYQADGTLWGTREDVVAKDLPEAVRNTLSEKYPGGEIVKAETEVRNGIVLYEVKLKVKGETQHVKLSDKGEIIQKDDD